MLHAAGSTQHRQAFQATPEDEDVRLHWGEELVRNLSMRLGAGSAAVQAARLPALVQAIQLSNVMNHAGRSSQPLALSMAGLLHRACQVTASKSHPEAAARLLDGGAGVPETVTQQLTAAAAGAVSQMLCRPPQPQRTAHGAGTSAVAGGGRHTS